MWARHGFISLWLGRPPFTALPALHSAWNTPEGTVAHSAYIAMILLFGTYGTYDVMNYLHYIGEVNWWNYLHYISITFMHYLHYTGEVINITLVKLLLHWSFLHLGPLSIFSQCDYWPSFCVLSFVAKRCFKNCTNRAPNPTCGTDGRWYRNNCARRKHNCDLPSYEKVKLASNDSICTSGKQIPS